MCLFYYKEYILVQVAVDGAPADAEVTARNLRPFDAREQQQEVDFDSR